MTYFSWETVIFIFKSIVQICSCVGLICCTFIQVTWSNILRHVRTAYGVVYDAFDSFVLIFIGFLETRMKLKSINY